MENFEKPTPELEALFKRSLKLPEKLFEKQMDEDFAKHADNWDKKFLEYQLTGKEVKISRKWFFLKYRILAYIYVLKDNICKMFHKILSNKR